MGSRKLGFNKQRFDSQATSGPVYQFPLQATGPAPASLAK